MYIVYEIKNTINSKSYIGYTSRTLEQRWKSHVSAALQGNRCRFHFAIKKYGPDPWIKTILYETDCKSTALKIEEDIIAERGNMDKIKGYNAKPGGCGGWIVKPENMDRWKKNQSIAQSGAKNSNSLNITNEEIIDVMMKFVDRYGFIPGRNRIRKFAETLNVQIPKSFQKYRFGGSFQTLTDIIEQKTGLKYNRFHRDDEQKQKLRLANLGKKRNDKS